MNKTSLDRLKIIVDKKPFCPSCSRFLDSEETRYSYGNRYCIHHIHEDLNEGATLRAYVELVEQVVEEEKQIIE